MKYTQIRTFAASLAAACLLLSLAACKTPEKEYSPDDTSRAPVGTGSVTVESYASPETVVPAPEGTTSGRFTSDESITLRLLCDWTRTPGRDGTDTLTVTISLSSYSLQVSARPGMGKLTVGDQTRAYSSDPISIDNNKTPTVTPLYTASFQVPAGQPVTVSASWPFNGTYHGEALKSIVCDGVVK